MRKHEVKTLVFSSSATVYGIPESVPVSEVRTLTGTINPYGESKLIVENILRDLSAASDPELAHLHPALLQPRGCTRQRRDRRRPQGHPQQPHAVHQPGSGRPPAASFSVFGGDYETCDGTGVRDYIHVVDLARGHLAALDYLARSQRARTCAQPRHGTRLLRARSGARVREGERQRDPVRDRRSSTRRPPPAPTPIRSKANEELGWQAEFDLDAMCVRRLALAGTPPDGLLKAAHLDAPSLSTKSSIIPPPEGWLSGRKHWS